MFNGHDGNEKILDPEDFQIFKEKFPMIANCILNPEIILENEQILQKIKSDVWKSNAKKILDHLWKAKDARLFHNPVDPIALNIPDYLKVIKKPMDFSTIKKKLNLNMYKDGHEFMNDMKLVFDNCDLFNGTESDVG